MTRTTLAPDLRAQLLAAPEALLNDAEVMRALMDARDAEQGGNVIDIRGRWMARLEERLDDLQTTHRHVLAAAYDNVAGTRQVHRAALALIGAADLAGLLAVLGDQLAVLLRIESVRLLIEDAPVPLAADTRAALLAHPRLVELSPAGAVAARLAVRRAQASGVTLRRTGDDAARAHPHANAPIASEAVLPLSLGGARAGLLLLGATEAATFAPLQGSDLMAFLQGVIDALLARML
ncbi:DUF484 family protein [Paracoccus sp. p4-l81]|uniref:DUF484 family protein n=1 Tax=Paracoccus sp. p4-l81 TaxID=3342806 RepID=UPI0035BA13D7